MATISTTVKETLNSYLYLYNLPKYTVISGVVNDTIMCSTSIRVHTMGHASLYVQVLWNVMCPRPCSLSPYMLPSWRVLVLSRNTTNYIVAPPGHRTNVINVT